jgi:hypothetical protein
MDTGKRDTSLGLTGIIKKLIPVAAMAAKKKRPR